MTPKIQNLRNKIRARTVELGIETRHTDKAHFYYIPAVDKVFGSVSAEHRHIKDPSIRNFEKNEAIRYMAAHYKEFTDQNIEEHKKKAAAAPILHRDEHGSIGNYIHGYRRIYFDQWIDS